MGNAGGPRSGGNFVEAAGLAINPIHGALEVRLWFREAAATRNALRESTALKLSEL